MFSGFHRSVGGLEKRIDQFERRSGGQCGRRFCSLVFPPLFNCSLKSVCSLPELTDAEKRDIYQMSQRKTIYGDLARSVAPTVFGHDEIKRGLLLMMMGGVHKARKKTGHADLKSIFSDFFCSFLWFRKRWKESICVATLMCALWGIPLRANHSF